MKRFCVIAFVGALSVCAYSLRASNIQIEDVRLLEKDDLSNGYGEGHVYIHFSLSWDFSWKDRSHNNWDAAWVFCKARTKMDLEWKHVWLDIPENTPQQKVDTVPGFIAPPHKIIEKVNVPIWCELGTSITEDGLKYVGCFIYKKNTGYEDMNIKGICLGWQYTNQGYAVEDELVVTVFGIEMVYIPEGSFILGDGFCQNSLFVEEADKNIIVRNFRGSSKNNMGKITGETGYKYKGTPIPDEYPKGSNHFYIMKYEISQHGYVDFLNTLTYAQQSSRVNMAPNGKATALAMSTNKTNDKIGINAAPYRNYVRIRVPGTPAKAGSVAVPATYGHNRNNYDGLAFWVMEHNAGNVACNFLSWNDGLAFMDWACLRPITELEFEKVCRGPKFMRGEYAWGNANGKALHHPTETFFVNEDWPSEEPNNPSKEYNYMEIGKAPWSMRCGAFSHDSSSRYEAGAAYYGVCNMSDCLWDRCVNVSTEEGRSFVPVDGDGMLDENGNANVTVNPAVPGSVMAWPTMSGGGFRGFQVSNRTYAESIAVPCEGTVNYRAPSYGFRGARSAPSGTVFNPF